jgi:hypothetical protein
MTCSTPPLSAASELAAASAAAAAAAADAGVDAARVRTRVAANEGIVVFMAYRSL